MSRVSEALRAPVRLTEVRIATPLICSGHIDRRIGRQVRCCDPCGFFSNTLTHCPRLLVAAAATSA
jgi:hypothetical protein